MIVGVGHIEPVAGIHLQPQGVIKAGRTDATVIGAVAGKVGLTNDGISSGIRGLIGKDQDAMVAAVGHIEFITNRVTGHRVWFIHAPIGWWVRCNIAPLDAIVFALTNHPGSLFAVCQGPFINEHPVVITVSNHQVIMVVNHKSHWMIEGG